MAEHSATPAQENPSDTIRRERHIAAAQVLAVLLTEPLPQPMRWSIWDKGDILQPLPQITGHLSRYDIRELTDRRDALSAWASFLNVDRLTPGYGSGSMHASAIYVGVYVDMWTEFTSQDMRDLRTWTPSERGPAETTCIFRCGFVARPVDLEEHEQLDHVACHLCHARPVGRAPVSHTPGCTSPRADALNAAVDHA